MLMNNIFSFLLFYQTRDCLVNSLPNHKILSLIKLRAFAVDKKKMFLNGGLYLR